MTLSHESVEPPADQPMPMSTADTVRSRVMAANALLHVHEYEAAIRAFESAVDLAPDQPRPRYQLAVACALAGKRERALANLAGAVEAGFRQPDLLAAEPAFAGYRIELDVPLEPRARPPQPAPVRRGPGPPRLRLLRRPLARHARPMAPSPAPTISRRSSAARP